MNQTYQITNNPNEPLIFTITQGENLTTWGIFISSILLSSGAFIAQVLAQIQKSKCSRINCGITTCVREV
jgi:hypothetical protein